MGCIIRRAYLLLLLGQTIGKELFESGLFDLEKIKIKISFLLLLVVAAMIIKPHSCIAQKNKQHFIDRQTPKGAIPFISSDATSKRSLSKIWKLHFSDEFNGNKIDTGKWNVEQTIKKLVDITLYEAHFGPVNFMCGHWSGMWI